MFETTQAVAKTAMDAKSISELVKNYAQVGAWLGAGFYFLAQLLKGDQVIDLSLNVTCERQNTATFGIDYLKVSVEMKKGTRGTFQIKDAVVFITEGEDTDHRQKRELDFERYEHTGGSSKLKIAVNKRLGKSPKLNLSPGESANSGFWTQVRSDQPCLVEANVMGTGFGSPYISQWRASTASLPCSPPTPAIGSLPPLSNS